MSKTEIPKFSFIGKPVADNLRGQLYSAAALGSGYMHWWGPNPGEVVHEAFSPTPGEPKHTTKDVLERCKNASGLGVVGYLGHASVQQAAALALELGK